MRIAMIGQKGFDVGEEGGGVERHVTELATRLGRLGHEVSVYARRPCEKDPPKGVHVLVLPSIHRKHLEAITHTFFATLDVIRKPYDIIHYHGVGPATLAWVPRLLKRNARVIVTFHSRDRFQKKWGRLARAYLYFGEWAAVWFPHATIAVSHAIAVYARKQLCRQIIYIPNGAAIKEVRDHTTLEPLGLTSQQYLLSVSRLVPHKGQHYLIEAFQSLQSDEPDLTKGLSLVIVGAESYTAYYQMLLSRLAQGNPSIRFLGFQFGVVLDQLFAHAKLFVHASEAEGMPMVVLEAMSFGVPVLVSDIPENLEALHHTGFTFTNGSAPDLAKVLASLLRHPELLDKARDEAKEVVRHYFNWDLITEETLVVYRSMKH